MDYKHFVLILVSSTEIDSVPPKLEYLGRNDQKSFVYGIDAEYQEAVEITRSLPGRLMRLRKIPEIQPLPDAHFATT